MKHSQLAPISADFPFKIVSETIGQGAYACIKKAIDPRNPRTVFAVKFINKAFAQRHGKLSKRQLDMETSLHACISGHPHVVTFFKSGEDEVWRWIAMELVEGGDLFDKIESDVGVGEDVAHFYFTQLISAVTFMHEKKISHRDIKPENILLTIDGNLKIADFGLATLFEHRGERKLCQSSCGSPPYTAPEVLSESRKARHILSQGYHPDLVDIWSCAIVLFVLLVGNTPWDEPTSASAEYQDFRSSPDLPQDELWQDLPRAVVPLLRGMMDLEPKQRWSLDRVRQHAWFRRANPYLQKTPQELLNLATEMLETMKVDFSREPIPGEFCGRAGQDAIISERIDWEMEGQGVTQGPNISSQAHVTSTQTWDDRLADDPMCSQFSSTPRVPMTMTQCARRFGDVMPSLALTRFFSFWNISRLVQLLQTSLQRQSGPCLASLTSTDHDRRAEMKVKVLDPRKCALEGSIVVTQLSGNGGEILEVIFHRGRGDQVQWRRFFKNIVVDCKEAVFAPTEGWGASQMEASQMDESGA